MKLVAPHVSNTCFQYLQDKHSGTELLNFLECNISPLMLKNHLHITYFRFFYMKFIVLCSDSFKSLSF